MPVPGVKPAGPHSKSHVTPVAPRSVQDKSADVSVIFSAIKLEAGIHSGAAVTLTVKSAVTPKEPS